jgi:hypothetical protein
VEPPGLFRGRGDHPKMGFFKRRIYPRDITINIGARPPACDPYLITCHMSAMLTSCRSSICRFACRSGASRQCVTRDKR